MVRTLAKDHDDKRQLILAGAAHVFASTGFDRASVSSVAQKCDISKANIYHYYASKNDILFDILETHLCSLRDTVFQSDSPDANPEERFLATLTNILMAYSGADNEHKLQVNSLAQLPEDKQQILRGYQLELVERLSGIIHAVAPDSFRKGGHDLRAITMSVFAMLNWYYMWDKKNDAPSRVKYAKTVFDLTLNGIRGND